MTTPRRPLPPTIADIDARSKKLIRQARKDSRELFDQLVKENPEMIAKEGFDDHKAWEGWAIQKLSSLQLYVEYLEKVVIALAGEIRELQDAVVGDSEVG